MKSHYPNKRLLWKLIAGVIFMFAFCYMLVPLYSLVCKQVGINGKVYGQSTVAPVAVDSSRTITLELTTTLHDQLAFQFHPAVKRITLHPGETKTVYFYIENQTKKTALVQAVPSIAPGLAAKYIKKTQCFCFTQQAFNIGEKAEMPVIFHIDPDIPKEVNWMTLNYTLFDANAYAKEGPHRTPGRIDL